MAYHSPGTLSFLMLKISAKLKQGHPGGIIEGGSLPPGRSRQGGTKQPDQNISQLMTTKVIFYSFLNKTKVTVSQ